MTFLKWAEGEPKTSGWTGTYEISRDTIIWFRYDAAKERLEHEILSHSQKEFTIISTGVSAGEITYIKSEFTEKPHQPKDGDTLIITGTLERIEASDF